jgi:AmiR/NasT family two-component response regulator
MITGKPPTLRVLVADGSTSLQRAVTATVTALGHSVIAVEHSLSRVAPVTAAELPDVALVIVGESSADALRTIRELVGEAACPVIAILAVEDAGFIDQAARLGIFAHIVGNGDLGELQSSMDIALRRFAEYHALEGAFGRRALTERAKGVLMERHSIDEEQAFNMLRDEARRTQRKLIDVAQAVVSSHRLLSRGPEGSP